MTEIMDILVAIGYGAWLIVPAYIPNAAASIIGKKWGSVKMDFGKTWNGKRIFGDGKSWAGFIGGALVGVALGLIMIGISSIWDPVNYFGYGPFWGNVGILFCLSFGALFGDLCGAFIKRRLGMERGQKAPILDQYDFIAGCFIITYIFYPNFIYSNFFEGVHIAAFITILLVTFIIHRSVNILGYKMGIKNEPW